MNIPRKFLNVTDTPKTLVLRHYDKDNKDDEISKKKKFSGKKIIENDRIVVGDMLASKQILNDERKQETK